MELFRVNKINRFVLVTLNRADMKELGITVLGDGKELQDIIAKLNAENNLETSNYIKFVFSIMIQ